MCIRDRCWIRRDDGEVHNLPVRRWLGGKGADDEFDSAVLGLCSGPTIDLGCGPGRFVTELIRAGIPALGIDQSATAISLARRSGAPVLRRDIFESLPGTGRWQTVLLADGNVGLGGDPLRMLRRSAELLSRGGKCVVEFDAEAMGIRSGWVRLESTRTIGPWFRWALVGIDSAASLAKDAGLAMSGVHTIGRRVVATLTLP